MNSRTAPTGCPVAPPRRVFLSAGVSRMMAWSCYCCADVDQTGRVVPPRGYHLSSAKSGAGEIINKVEGRQADGMKLKLALPKLVTQTAAAKVA